MISVVPEDGGEDINMKSYGEEEYEEGYEGEYTDTEEDGAPPEYTTADEGYQGGEGITMEYTKAPSRNLSPRIPW